MKPPAALLAGHRLRRRGLAGLDLLLELDLLFDVLELLVEVVEGDLLFGGVFALLGLDDQRVQIVHLIGDLAALFHERVQTIRHSALAP
jgi:hypothetical protein